LHIIQGDLTTLSNIAIAVGFFLYGEEGSNNRALTDLMLGDDADLILGDDADLIEGALLDLMEGALVDLMLGALDDLILGDDADLIEGALLDLILGDDADLIEGALLDLILGALLDLMLGEDADLILGPLLELELELDLEDNRRISSAWCAPTRSDFFCKRNEHARTMFLPSNLSSITTYLFIHRKDICCSFLRQRWR
jgi:hypothetical protein